MKPTFSGTSVHKLDEKGRVVLPKRVLDQVAPAHREFTVTAGLDGNLLLLDKDGWGQISTMFTARPIGSRAERSLKRRFFGLAEAVSPDKAGRIPLSKALRGVAGLDEEGAEVLVVGVDGTIELWAQARFNESLSEPSAEEEAFFNGVPAEASLVSPSPGSQP